MTTTYSSPVLLIRRMNGEFRLVIDYQRLNAQTERIQFPLPSIDECLERLSDANIFAILDLYNGYIHLPLSPEARHKTAFITPDGTGEFTPVAYGLMNAPSTFPNL